MERGRNGGWEGGREGEMERGMEGGIEGGSLNAGAGSLRLQHRRETPNQQRKLARGLNQVAPDFALIDPRVVVVVVDMYCVVEYCQHDVLSDLVYCAVLVRRSLW